MNERVAHLDLPVNALELDCGQSVEGSFFEVNILEVGVHVEAGCTEVICSGNVRNHALSTFSNIRQAHPHIPVPGLKQNIKTSPSLP